MAAMKIDPPGALNASFMNGSMTRLSAMGFDAQGVRTGGILDPREVELPATTVIIRTFGGGSKDDGEWWFTPFELARILGGIGHENLSLGRAESKSVLHAFMAVLPKFGNTMDYFTVAELVVPLAGYFGEGGHTTIGASEGRKAPLFLDGAVRRRARQLFLPRFCAYASRACKRLVARGRTDSELPLAIRQYGARRLPFE